MAYTAVLLQVTIPAVYPTLLKEDTVPPAHEAEVNMLTPQLFAADFIRMSEGISTHCRFFEYTFRALSVSI